MDVATIELVIIGLVTLWFVGYFVYSYLVGKKDCTPSPVGCTNDCQCTGGQSCGVGSNGFTKCCDKIVIGPNGLKQCQ